MGLTVSEQGGSPDSGLERKKMKPGSSSWIREELEVPASVLGVELEKAPASPGRGGTWVRRQRRTWFSQGETRKNICAACEQS
jgi:hypothetical protein